MNFNKKKKKKHNYINKYLIRKYILRVIYFLRGTANSCDF